MSGLQFFITVDLPDDLDFLPRLGSATCVENLSQGPFGAVTKIYQLFQDPDSGFIHRFSSLTEVRNEGRLVNLR